MLLANVGQSDYTWMAWDGDLFGGKPVQTDPSSECQAALLSSQEHAYSSWQKIYQKDQTTQ